MAEIEITLPTVQYGNVKVRATPEELGLSSVADAYDVGVASAVYLNVFTQGFKKGASLDVSPPQEAPVSASEGEVGTQAQEWLDEGLGGVTEVHEDSTEEVSDDGQNDAPWNSTVDAKAKPWETGATAPVKVAEIDWS